MQRRNYHHARKDAERVRAYAWRDLNPVRFKVHKRNYKAKRTREGYYRAQYAADPVPILAMNRRWRLRNAHKIRAYVRSAAGKAIQRALDATRRARKRGADGRVTAQDYAAILGLQRGRCAICRTRLAEGFHRDHILPLRLGGRHHRRNIQITCSPCNLRKGAKHPLDFMRKLGFLL